MKRDDLLVQCYKVFVKNSEEAQKVYQTPIQ